MYQNQIKQKIDFVIFFEKSSDFAQLMYGKKYSLWGGGTHMSEVYGYVPLWRPHFSGLSAVPDNYLFTTNVIS